MHKYFSKYYTKPTTKNRNSKGNLSSANIWKLLTEIAPTMSQQAEIRVKPSKQKRKPLFDPQSHTEC